MTSPGKGIFRAGTSGLVLAEPNKAAFPDAFRKSTRLSYYASLFNSIEINSTFYKLPMAATFAKWAAEVGNEFQFTVKLGRNITHVKDLEFSMEDLDKFLHAADNIGPKKGCLLIQLPPSVDDSRAGALEGMLHRVAASGAWAKGMRGRARQEGAGHHWRTAVEFRHPSWYRTGIREMLDHYHASVVLQDMPSSATRTLNKKAPFVYLRYHGLEGDYKGGYPDSHLRQEAKDIMHWLSLGKDVYAYFNNTIGDAVADLVTLQKLVASFRESAWPPIRIADSSPGSSGPSGSPGS